MMQKTTLRALVALLVVSCQLAGIGWRAQAQAVGWGFPERLSSDAGEASEGFMVADHYGYIHLFWTVSGFPDGRSIIQYSRFDGDTWSVPMDIFVGPINIKIGMLSPEIDQNGNLHLIWVLGNTGPVLMSSAPVSQAMTAQGWSKPSVIDIPAYRARLKIDTQGNFHILYTELYGDQPGVYHVASKDGSQTWSSPYKLDPDIPSIGNMNSSKDMTDADAISTGARAGADRPARARSEGALAQVSWIAYWLTRVFTWFATHTLDRIHARGLEYLPVNGGALLVCNHDSFIDPFLIGLSAGRYIRFIMWRAFYEKTGIHWFTRRMGAIPISDEDPPRKIVESMRHAQARLRAGELVCIFAEGAITRTGNLLRFDAAGPEVVADVYSGSLLGRRLIGQLPGLRLDALNVFFAQARDAAGEYSTAIRMPSGTDHWFVRRPRGRLLLVTDYITFDAPLALSTYLAALASIPGGNYVTVDRLDISLGLSSSDKSLGKLGRLVPAYVDPALIHTFLLFDELLWYTDQFPTLSVAQLTLLLYMQNGGRVLFTTSFQTSIDPRGALRDFAPIDSISSVDLSPNRPLVPPAVAGDSRIPANFILYADSTDPARIYSQLAFNTSPSVHSVFMRPVYRRTDARYIYHLQAETRTPVRYFGGPNLAVVDGRKTIIFIGVPLHLLNNTSVGNPLGVGAFLEMVLETEFSPAQRVNRRMF